jgi:NAD+ diphosphatase
MQDPHRQVCSGCGFILYHNSSPCMGALPIDDRGRVLLARRGIEPFRGGWNTIGGFLNYQEEPLDGLRREVREETGVDCDILEFITMIADRYGDNGTALMCSHFTVRLLSSDFKPQDDVSELEWFSLDSLPGNIPFESDRRALAALRERHCKKK